MNLDGIDLADLRDCIRPRRVYDESGNYIGRATWDGAVRRIDATGFSIGGSVEYAFGNAVQFRQWRMHQSRKSKRALWRGPGCTFAEFVKRYPLG